MRRQDEIKPFSNWQVVLILSSLICLLGIFGLPGITERNGRLFNEFANQINASEIKEIEIHRLKSPEQIIVVHDQASVAKFVLLMRAIEEHKLSRYVGMNETAVYVKLKDGQIHKFECFALEGTGKKMYIGRIQLSVNKKSYYGFGVGDAQFPNDDFYKWLVSVGVTMDE